jgi:hypothetical protein
VHIVNITSRQQEFAGGFVDFLLGRGDHHPRSYLGVVEKVPR